jgi:hypothetical protein
MALEGHPITNVMIFLNLRKTAFVIFRYATHSGGRKKNFRPRQRAQAKAKIGIVVSQT